MDEDLPAVSNEQYTSERLGILRGDEGLADTGGGDHQRLVHTLGTGAVEGVQCGDLRSFGDHAAAMFRNLKGWPPPTIAVLPENFGCQRTGAFGEEMVELLLERSEGFGIHIPAETVIPLHTIRQSGGGDVGGTDDDAVIVWVDGTNDVGLGMEGDGILGEQPDLDIPFQGHELLQCEGRGYTEIGSGEDTNADTAVKGGYESVGDQGETGFLEKGYDDVDGSGCG